MEAENIALSQSMPELIPTREVVLEMQKLVFGGRKVLECRSYSKIYEDASIARLIMRPIITAVPTVCTRIVPCTQVRPDPG
jgi:hypothetical protein